MSRDYRKHLIRGGNDRFYFRMAVPTQLRAVLGKTEIKRALKTTDRRLAERLAISYAVQYEVFFAQLRINGQLMPPKFRTPTPEDLLDYEKGPRCDLTLKSRVLADGTKETTLELDPDKPEAEKALLQAFKEQFGTLDQLESAMAGGDGRTVFVTPQTVATNSESSGLLLSAAIDQFCQEKSMAARAARADEECYARWSPRTADQNRARLNLLLELVGDQPISGFTQSTAVAMKNYLLKWPKNRKKMPKYRDLSNDQLKKKTIPAKDLVSLKTVNEHLIVFRSFFSWAESHAGAQPNVFKDLKLQINTQAIDDRPPYTDEDLQKIFSDQIFQTAKPEKPFQYWMPLLALFSGARLEELASLRVDDIREVDGIKCFSINEEHGRSTKTKNSIRVVPIHSRLLSLGFEKFVKSRKTKLFPELSANKYGKQGPEASDWYREFRRARRV